MTRRDLLRLLLAAPLAAAVDVEQFLWVPSPMVTVPAMPLRVVDTATGISIRFVRQYDISTDRWPSRIYTDVLEGIPSTRQPDFRVR